VEIFEPYRNPVWDYAYDRVLIGDIRDRWGELGRYDAILCLDVLEHFPKDQAVCLARDLLTIAPLLFVTTPSRAYPKAPGEEIPRRNTSVCSGRAICPA